MLCKAEEKDARKCLNAGKEVTRCGIEFFKKVRGSCALEFTSYAACIDHAGRGMELWRSVLNIYGSHLLLNIFKN